MQRFLWATFLLWLSGIVFWGNAIADDLSEAAKEELAGLAGKWRFVSHTVAGKELPSPAEKIVLLEKDRLGGMNEPALQITLLGPENSPKIINLTAPGGKKTVEGIYKLTDDRWTICFNIDGTAERPADFENKDKKNLVIMTLERVK